MFIPPSIEKGKRCRDFLNKTFNPYILAGLDFMTQSVPAEMIPLHVDKNSGQRYPGQKFSFQSLTVK
jgi:hypothetical protein